MDGLPPDLGTLITAVLLYSLASLTTKMKWSRQLRHLSVTRDCADPVTSSKRLARSHNETTWVYMFPSIFPMFDLENEPLWAKYLMVRALSPLHNILQLACCRSVP